LSTSRRKRKRAPDGRAESALAARGLDQRRRIDEAAEVLLVEMVAGDRLDGLLEL
jgi:hypothetical protein